MRSMRKLLGKIPEGLLALIMLICVFGFLGSFLGLGLQLSEKVLGERDFSKWVIMSIAEEPTEDLFVLMAISIGILLFCILIVKFAEKEPRKIKTSKKYKR